VGGLAVGEVDDGGSREFVCQRWEKRSLRFCGVDLAALCESARLRKGGVSSCKLALVSPESASTERKRRVDADQRKRECDG
jgi:hypothetical protein